MNKNIVGIDIGSHSVRAVEMKNPDKTKPTVLKFHEVPLPDGSVRRGEVLEVATVADALKQLWATGGFTTKNVVLGMGGPRVLSRDLSLPKAPIAQLRESLPFHVQDMLPVPVNEALLDFYPISEFESEAGMMVKGLLVAAIKDAVSANVEAVTQAGLRPAQVDLIPFALARALAPARSKPGLSAVVSIGANTTNVVIVLDGVPQFVRIIAAGGDDITRALVSRLEIAPGEAESFKRDFGLNSSGVSVEKRPAAEIVYEVAGELLTSIRNTLSYYVNTTPGSALQRVIVSGGGSQMPGLVQAIGEWSKIPVEIAEPLGGADFSRAARVKAPDEHNDAMTTAFGLALGASA